MGEYMVCVVVNWLHVAIFSWNQAGAFTPPVERETYIEAKNKYDSADDSVDVDDLKKLLMKRAIKTIPILLSLQNEGSSIERLYKRGMLTDDMHFKVKEIKSFVDQEFQDIQLEADELGPGWGSTIWQQAMQFHQVRLFARSIWFSSSYSRCCVHRLFKGRPKPRTTRFERLKRIKGRSCRGVFSLLIHYFSFCLPLA